MYRAVEQITQNLFVNIQGRKVIVLLSDGKDFGSSITKGALLNQLEESDVLIYTIFYKTGAGSNKLAINSEETTEGENESKNSEKRSL